MNNSFTPIQDSKGILFIVATPIGNLQDISLRALEVLKTVDFICAEDTRHSQQLLNHYQIQNKLMALHEHNETQQIEYLLDCLQKGMKLALISDAGTPLISDPGYQLVKNCQKHHIQVSPIPGACAAVAALSAAGLASDHFYFEGFLPAKANARQNRLADLYKYDCTIIFYEAPHRIIDSLTDMLHLYGPSRQIVLAREITKQFETIYSASLEEMLAFVRADEYQQKGEMVLLLEKSPMPVETTELLNMLSILNEELPLKKACQIAAKLTGKKKNELYDLWLKQQDNQGSKNGE